MMLESMARPVASITAGRSAAPDSSGMSLASVISTGEPMSETTNASEVKQQEDTITLEYFGLTIQASRAKVGTAVDLGIGVERYMAYHDEDEDEDYDPGGGDLDQDDEDDLDEDDLDEDENEEEEEDQDDDDDGLL
jgi:hypothetical protein